MPVNATFGSIVHTGKYWWQIPPVNATGQPWSGVPAPFDKIGQPSLPSIAVTLPILLYLLLTNLAALSYAASFLICLD